jgi:hypothetical protein
LGPPPTQALLGPPESNPSIKKLSEILCLLVDCSSVNQATLPAADSLTFMRSRAIKSNCKSTAANNANLVHGAYADERETGKCPLTSKLKDF